MNKAGGRREHGVWGLVQVEPRARWEPREEAASSSGSMLGSDHHRGG